MSFRRNSWFWHGLERVAIASFGDRLPYARVDLRKRLSIGMTDSFNPPYGLAAVDLSQVIS
jgi:hypothetical protein